jgi:hypothetical protein
VAGSVARERRWKEGGAGQQGGGRGLPERWVNVEAPIWTGAAAFMSGSADAVVTSDGEGLLQLQEVSGVPLGDSTEEARQAIVAAVSRGRPRWKK